MRLFNVVTPLALGVALLSSPSVEAKQGQHKGNHHPGQAPGNERGQSHTQAPRQARTQPRIGSRVFVLRPAPARTRVVPATPHKAIVTRHAAARRGAVVHTRRVAPRYAEPEVRAPYHQGMHARLPAGAVRVLFNGVPYFRVQHRYYRHGPDGFVPRPFGR